MRTSALLPLASFIALAILPLTATAQGRQVYEASGEVASRDTTQVPFMSGPALLRQAEALVSMAQEAPSGASTYPNAREAALAARAALDAYNAAVANYSNGYTETADSAARVAIEKAGFAAAVAVRPPAPPLEMVSEGEAGSPAPATLMVPNPAPATDIGSPNNYVTSSYAGLTPQPFGTYPASGRYVPLYSTPLPFGVTPVGRTPALVAP